MGKFRTEWAKKKPKKPSRPFSSWTNFVLNFKVLAQPTNRTLFKNASEAWKILGNAEKNLYVDHDAVALYKGKMAEYKGITAAMKEPPGPYGLYVSHYWKSKKPGLSGRQSFGDISKQIAAEWNGMDDEEQDVYRAGSNLLKALYEKEQVAVLSGVRNLNLNWRNSEVGKVHSMLTGGSQNQGNQQDQSVEEGQTAAIERNSENEVEDYDDSDYDDSDYDDDD